MSNTELWIGFPALNTALNSTLNWTSANSKFTLIQFRPEFRAGKQIQRCTVHTLFLNSELNLELESNPYFWIRTGPIQSANSKFTLIQFRPEFRAGEQIQSCTVHTLFLNSELNLELESNPYFWIRTGPIQSRGANSDLYYIQSYNLKLHSKLGDDFRTGKRIQHSNHEFRAGRRIQSRIQGRGGNSKLYSQTLNSEHWIDEFRALNLHWSTSELNWKLVSEFKAPHSSCELEHN